MSEKDPAFLRRSKAAKKGWETRRKNARRRAAREAKRKRSLAARKGWETRRVKRAREKAREALPEPSKRLSKPRQMEERLRAAMVAVKPLVDAYGGSSTARTRVTKDGKVTGHFRVYNLPKKANLNDFLIDMENSLVEPKGFYVWVRYIGDFEPTSRPEPKEPGKWEAADKESRAYEKFKGQEKIAVYPHKPDGGRPYMYTVARGIAEKLGEQRRPSEIHFLFQWDGEGSRPKRR